MSSEVWNYFLQLPNIKTGEEILYVRLVKMNGMKREKELERYVPISYFDKKLLESSLKKKEHYKTIKLIYTGFKIIDTQGICEKGHPDFVFVDCSSNVEFKLVPDELSNIQKEWFKKHYFYENYVLYVDTDKKIYPETINDIDELCYRIRKKMRKFFVNKDIDYDNEYIVFYQFVGKKSPIRIGIIQRRQRYTIFTNERLNLRESLQNAGKNRYYLTSAFLEDLYSVLEKEDYK